MSLVSDYDNNLIKMKRQKEGKTRSLHTPYEGVRLADIVSKPAARVTHDYNGILGWNRKD